MLNVIDYMPGDTLLHKLNPVAKVALAASIIAATFLSDSYAMLVGLLAFTLLMGAYAGVVGRLVVLMKLLVPLALILFVLQVLFMRAGTPVFGFATDEGLITGSKACLRLLGVATPLLLMLMVTPLGDLANACVEKLHIPYRYAFTFTTALRFVPIFSQEMNAIMEAQTARGVEYDTKNPLKKMRLMLPLCVPLLLSSVAKPTPRRLLPSSGGFTCARVRAPTIATRSWRETMRPSPCALRSLCWVLRFSRRHWCLCECAKWLASLKKGVDCSTPFVHVREWRVYKRDARIRSAGSGSSGRRRFCGTQTCQR